MAYKAIVARIHTRPLPGADRLLIGSCGQYQVVVGIGTEDGQLGVFFEQDGQLSEEFAAKNDLVRRKNEDGTPAGGMFEENRRVKAIKLRGVKSEGFWCPLSSLAYTGVELSTLAEGVQFDELNGHAICNKYFTPATTRTNRTNKVQKDNPMFHKHIDTGLFKREVHLIPAGSTCYVTEKLHGTSFRLGHVLDETPVWNHPWLYWLAKAIGLPTTRRQWTHLVGSRNVILDHGISDKSFYGTEEFRYRAVEGIRLHKGEVIYGEIVGYDHNGKSIMATQNIGGLKDKSLKERYGSEITYTYGTQVGQCKLFIYRITQVNEDGIVTELSWNQVLKRCRELGLTTVPLLHRFYFPDSDSIGICTEIVSGHTEQNDGTPLTSTLDARHIREGVVVRYESEHGVGWMKNKSFTFGVLEGYLKESDEYVDAEESA